MRDLHTWPTNPFDDPHIGLDGLLAFTTNNLQRMENDSTVAEITARILPTTTALAGVNTAFQTDLSKLGLRKTSKQAKDAFRKTLPAGISKIYVALEAKYGEKSPQLASFFPIGRSGLNKTPDDQLGNNLQALIDALTAAQTDVGAPVVTQATALLTDWNAVYTPSETASGAKNTTRQAKKAARAALQLELFKNLLTIAMNFPRQPEKVDVYMQQSLLEPHTQSTETPPAPPASPTTDP